MSTYTKQMTMAVIARNTMRCSHQNFRQWFLSMAFLRPLTRPFSVWVTSCLLSDDILADGG